MTSACERHRAEPAMGECGACALSFCDRCLVHVQRRAHRPLCVGCALEAAGIRPKRRRERLTLRQRRARRKAMVAALAAARDRQGAQRETVTAAELKALFWKGAPALALDRVSPTRPQPEPEPAVRAVVEPDLPTGDEWLPPAPPPGVVIDLDAEVIMFPVQMVGR